MSEPTSLLTRFHAAITSSPTPEPQDEELLIGRDGNLACHYAPFDHVNAGAKVVLLGLTPGTQQARSAINALRAALDVGQSGDEALQQAKKTASFSGPMRAYLVAMLDHLGLHHRLGIGSCADLFGSRSDLVHFTSTLRYPVFAGGQNYKGSPSILTTPFLLSMCERWLAKEIAVLSNALWIPLGTEAKAVLARMAARGLISPDRVLDGMPHPSGANAERIAYFLGTKKRGALSAKTNPERIDAAKRALLSKLNASNVAAPAAARDMIDSAPVSTPAPMREVTSASSGRQTVSNGRYARTFVLRDYQGRPLLPVRSRNGTFTLAPRGANMHRAEHAIRVEDEEKAFQMVVSGTYKIRAVREEGQAPSLLGLGDRVVKSAEKIVP